MKTIKEIHEEYKEFPIMVQDSDGRKFVLLGKAENHKDFKNSYIALCVPSGTQQLFSGSESGFIWIDRKKNVIAWGAK
jgi:hypothetical protein